MSSDESAALRERIARLEEIVSTIRNAQEAQDVKLTSIISTLDQMSGGKKLIWGVFAAIGAIAAAVAIATGLMELFRLVRHP